MIAENSHLKKNRIWDIIKKNLDFLRIWRQGIFRICLRSFSYEREGEHMKKRILGGILALLCLCGCASQEQDLSISASQQEQFTALMEDITEEYYWNFDNDSLQFLPAQIPENTEEYASFFAASADSAHNLQSYAGSTVILGTARLLHYNGDTAGQLLCYFNDHALIGVCYQGGYKNSYYSLKERNAFLSDGGFYTYEHWEGMPQHFSSSAATFPANGFLSTGKDKNNHVLTASIQDGAVRIYRYHEPSLQLWRTLSYPGSLEATAVTFLDSTAGSTLAVMLSSVTSQGSGEGEHVFTRSEKIVFYDENMQPTGVEIPLESGEGNALASAGNELMVTGNHIIQYYTLQEGSWNNTGYSRLGHSARYLHLTDLDGNGTTEYIMHDGMDLYIYQRNENTLRCIWSTHLGVESLYGPITSGDLNHDGVKEIYVCDMTGTTIRYILTEKGMRSANEDIVYGQCMYVCELNQDGYDDYWMIVDPESQKGSLYLSQTK